ncbi:OmpA family protein [uncultured Desulfobacter sp.]|uniref:OmpA family protein n=1 Tax=uncultured Desulfobacter sp. TaxID=240139 RepID=UPI002AAB8906|nr:OmpA family protein [uncultured Desulfobacter sp.]
MKFSSIKRFAFVLGALFLFGCYAQQPAKPIAGFTPVPFDSDRYASSVDNFLIVLDASSSMGKTYGGNSKFALARELVNRMNQILPEREQNAGLRSFGHDAAVSDKATLLFYGMSPYSTTALKEKLDMISMAGGTSPMSMALAEAGQDLNGVYGKTAVVIISDGQAENGLESPVTLAAAKTLKEQLGSGLCVYTVFVGDDAGGRVLMEEMTKTANCGFATTGDKLMTDGGMTQFVKDVFLVEKPMVAAPKEPMAAPAMAEAGVWVIDEAYFDFDKTVVKPGAYAYLDQIVEFLKAEPQAAVTIEGHTDNAGSLEYNNTLSLERAQAVKSYLTDRDIDEHRLSCKGSGYSKPVASNNTSKGRALNRRVEIHRVK